MSLRSIGAALLVPDIAPSTKLVLVGLANHDGPGGCWPGISTLASYANISTRQTKRCLADLAERGLIRVERNAGGGNDTRPDQRPNRYFLNLDGVTPTSPRNDDDGVTPMSPRPQSTGVTPTAPREANGVTPTTERGDTHVTNGVTPTSPEPSLNRKRTLSPLSELVQQRAALLRSAVDLMINRKIERGETIHSRSGLAAHVQRQLEADHANEIDRLTARMQRCSDAGQTLDVSVHAATLIDPSAATRLASVNPDPDVVHDPGCRLCQGTRYLDSDDPTNPGVLPCPGDRDVA